MTFQTYQDPGVFQTTFSDGELNVLLFVSRAVTPGIYYASAELGDVSVLVTPNISNKVLEPMTMDFVAATANYRTDELNDKLKVIATNGVKNPSEKIVNASVIAWACNYLPQLLEEFMEMRKKLTALDLLELVDVVCPICDGQEIECDGCNGNRGVPGSHARAVVQKKATRR